MKTYEFFTPGYSVIIQANDTFEAIQAFREKYNDASVIMIIDTEYFKIANRPIELIVR